MVFCGFLNLLGQLVDGSLHFFLKVLDSLVLFVIFKFGVIIKGVFVRGNRGVQLHQLAILLEFFNGLVMARVINIIDFFIFLKGHELIQVFIKITFC